MAKPWVRSSAVHAVQFESHGAESFPCEIRVTVTVSQGIRYKQNLKKMVRWQISQIGLKY